ATSGPVRDVKWYRQLGGTPLVADTGCYLSSSLPYELKTDVSLDEYIFRTDKHNVKGLWEWENGTVRVIELPSKFHEIYVGTIMKFLGASVLPVCFYYSPSLTNSNKKGCEADGSIIPVGKPQVSHGGSDGGVRRNEPWPNLVIEVAYAVTEAELKRKIETYWLAPNRAHDAMGIKLNYTPGVRPTIIDNSPAIGAFAPIMYEFGTVDRQDNPINIAPGQCVINIPLRCLYDGMPPTFMIPSPPLPDPIPLDLFHVRWAVLNR
ncbi:13814_t:CDS:2, partial [Ambispora leptoticha]